ncbi:sensor histidine kinase [Leucobacter sp. NPDC058333]|uniref:sensor histidine kinase n=1 Tax=Leucobacter sp. NPDC058333 TaxID=3346450 RepID=UPI00364EB9E8
MPRTPELSQARRPGLSARWKLTLSYVAVLMLTGGLLLAVVYVFLLRYVPSAATPTMSGYVPGRTDLIRAFLPAAAWALAALLGISLLGGWLLAGRMLAPLTHITRATRRAAAGSLGHRIELAGRRDEFRELADSFDAMLTQLEAQIAEQQRFAANASHELRTPLAITQTLLDVADGDPTSDRAALLARLRGVNTRAIDLTEALLVLSRAEQRAFTAERVDLSLIAEEAAESLLPLAEQRGLSLEVAGDAAIAAGSPALLLQVAMNLMHNAINHNSEAGFVRVTTARVRSDREAPPQVELSVENSGAHIAAHTLAMLTEPFQRGVERVRGDHGGFGLGLAIVQSVVRAHGGSLELRPRSDGGLIATVVLQEAR